MRAHNGEHLDSLPILDVSALKHVAYVFDALIYFMRSGSNADTSENEGVQIPSWNDQDENENEEADEELPVVMDTESLDDQEVANLSSTPSNLQNCSGFTSHSTGKGRKHFFFQVSVFKFSTSQYFL